jgi:hypothetical protein
MKNVIRVEGLAAAVCVLMIAQMPGVALGQATSAAESGWAKMTQCASIGDDKARHACTDGALRDAGLLSAETQAAAKRKAFGLQKPVDAPAAPAPAPAPATASVAAAAAPASPGSSSPPSLPTKQQKENLEVTLAKVEQGGDGKLVLTTTDGAVWRQVEGGVVRQTVAQGQTMKIEARSLGGFMCEPSKYVAFRCFRSK